MALEPTAARAGSEESKPATSSRDGRLDTRERYHIARESVLARGLWAKMPLAQWLPFRQCARRGMLALMVGTFKLVGMLDSPFVRRVAVALELYELGYENLPLRTVGDAAEFARYSPLKRAPTLVLADGAALVDSHMILAHLDELVPAQRCLTPQAAPARLACRQVVGVAAGLADKAVSAFYEKNFHAPEQRNARLLERNRGQLADSLTWLEARAPEQWLLGADLCHADIMVGAAVRFAGDALPDMLDLAPVPRVAAWCARLEALPVFRKTYLAFAPPK